MKFMHWTLIALFLAVPYGSQGTVAALFGQATASGAAALKIRLDGPSLDPLHAGASRRGRTSLPMQASAKLRYRSAFAIPAFRPCSLVLAGPSQAVGRDQIAPHFSDDIFHPPA